MAAGSLFTLDDLATQVCQNYGDVSDLTMAKARQWVNRALIMVSEVGDWSWLFVQGGSFPTIANTETYSVGVAARKLYAIYYTSGVNRKLQLINNRQFREQYTFAVTPTGTPFLYREAGRDSMTGFRKVSLYPIPSSVLTVYFDYVKEMPLLSATTDDVRIVTGMPTYMVDALIQLATAIAFNELDASNYGEQMASAIARWQGLYYEDTNEIDDVIRARAYHGGAIDYQDPCDGPTFPPGY